MTPLEQLLFFIIAQELDLPEFHKLPELLRPGFLITTRATGRPATKELVKEVIKWEEQTTGPSLESVLKEKFIIEVNPTPAATPVL